MPWNISARAAIGACPREARQQFQLIRKLERATTAGDIEALHDLRVAIRRLRVLLRAMDKPLAHTPAKTLSRRWQHFTRSLSAKRDADVWHALLRNLSNITPAFRRRVLAHVDQERGNLGALFADPTWSRLKRDTRTFLKTGLPGALTPAATPDRALRKAWKQATTRATKLAWSRQLAQPDAAHKTRIACRRVRYLAEFFAVAAGPKQDRRTWLHIAKGYQAAQAALGQTHDTDTLLEFLHTQRLRLPAELRAALVKRRNQGLTHFRQARKSLR